MSKKYFINNLDTAFGEALLNELVKQPTQDPVHMCTTRYPQDKKSNGIKKILKRQKPKLFRKKVIQECEVYVYSLNDTQLTDIEFGIESMQKPFEDNKVFILVSDIMVWSQSQRKIKKNQPPPAEEGVQKKTGEKDQLPPQDSAQEDIQGSGSIEEPDSKPIQYTYFEDGDQELRKPLKEYNYIKQIQDKVLSIKKQNVKVFIICPGIIYGCGEDTFYQLFKAAWLQDPNKLPYLLNGNNKIPTIHLIDLVKFVIKVAENPPQGPSYLLALDQTQDKTQKAIIQAISSGIGSGLIESVKQSKLMSHPEKFLIDLDMKPSKILIGTAEEPVQFQWVARKGLKDNIKSVLTDFCNKQKLRPMKMIITQNDPSWRKGSKAEFILKTFSDYYRIPVLDIKKILDYTKEYADDNLTQDLKEQWEKIHQYLLENQKCGLDQTMKVFYRAIRWRLQQNDCSNRGYILENFPQFQQEIEHIFIKINPKKLKRKIIKKKKVIPVPIVIESQKDVNDQDGGDDGNTQQKIPKQSLQQIPKENVQEPKQEQPQQQQIQEGEEGGPKIQNFYPESIIIIKQMGKQSTSELSDFFTSRGIEQLVYDTTNMKDKEIFQSLRNYIERNGRPNNYLISQQVLKQEYSKFIMSQNQQKLNDRQRVEAQKKKRSKEQEESRRKLAGQIYEIVRNQGQQEIKKMPFRNYLMQFVVPTLNQGLLEVSNIIPNDPVDLLAQYLYQKSYDV